ncbi:cytochrome P460 family protein [Hyphomicrobium sp.]|uniref:cytochrome P460 family protein n=1 Tax=Hyphomicrobium sp. TaxID=82 RepID=UPI000F9A1CF3|nr:cytochrome P460 family protein [Hyphomicrobium sp.]RUO97656.1 MAG: cytochrome C [Hyphomicrobium sp.]
MKAIYTAAAAGLFIVAAGVMTTLTHAQESKPAEQLIDAEGNLKIPSNYRETYQYLGSWNPAADQPGEGSKQAHNVYASPGTIEAFRKSGKFPDGTVLVKEVFSTKNDQMTTGLVSHVDKLQGWFMMIKETNNSHPENKLWGDGWAWSWFDAGQPNKTTSKDYQADCKGCHVPAQDTDWIYSSGYPALNN